MAGWGEKSRGVAHGGEAVLCHAEGRFRTGEGFRPLVVLSPRFTEEKGLAQGFSALRETAPTGI